MVYSLKHCSWLPYWFLQSTYFFLIFSFYVSQVHNSHKIPIEPDRIMLRIFQSSLGIQIGFHNITWITLNTQTCLKPDDRNRAQASSESVEGDLQPCRVQAVNLQSWNLDQAPSQKTARQHWTQPEWKGTGGKGTWKRCPRLWFPDNWRWHRQRWRACFIILLWNLDRGKPTS